MIIAIIDQGVETCHSRLSACKFNGIEIKETAKNEYQLGKHSYGVDDTGHGTSMAGIIHAICPLATIFVIKLSSYRQITEALLAKAIDYCRQVADIDIVHISMGVEALKPTDELVHVCREVHLSGKIIVAAGNNNYSPMGFYPACLPFTYGVSVGTVDTRLEYGYHAGNPLNILAYGLLQRVPVHHNGYALSGGCSMAAANFSGVVANMLLEHPGYDVCQVDALIRRKAKANVGHFYVFHRLPPDVYNSMTRRELKAKGKYLFQGKHRAGERLALFPVSLSEINTLISLKGDVKLHMTTYVDYPVVIGSTLGSRLHGHKIYRELTTIDYTAFDTMVTGCFFNQISDLNIAYSIELLKQCIKRNKNVITWDKNIYKLIADMVRNDYTAYSGRIEFAGVSAGDYEALPGYGYLPAPGIPTLCLLTNTGNEAELYIQLRLKSMLNHAGCKAVHLCAEPQGYLMGAEFVFPYMNENSFDREAQGWRSILKCAVKGIAAVNNPDVIVTGTNACVIPAHGTEDFDRVMAALGFLAAVEPGIYLYYVSANDDVDTICKTRDLIQSLFGRDILLFVTTPYVTEKIFDSALSKYIETTRRLPADELAARMSFLAAHFDIPVIDISEPANDDTLLRLIQARVQHLKPIEV